MANDNLSVKEMNDALFEKKDLFSYKEAAARFISEHKEFEQQLNGAGIPLRTTLQVKCDGTKLRIVDRFQVKDTLDTTTNTSAYTQNIVEFADIYLPTLVETFNQQANLFGATRKVPHMEGGNKYGWRLKTDQRSSLSVDPNDPQIKEDPVLKEKLQTDLKEYRIGVSVTDYTLFHSRAAIGDLFMMEVEARMRDLMRDINNDLFGTAIDTTSTKVIGLQAVANTAAYTSLYGYTRSAANRLAPDTATDTYTAVGGALTEANTRLALRSVESDGALRSNLRLWMHPKQRDALFALMAARQYLVSPNPAGQFGFASQTAAFSGVVYDGVPVCIDTSCSNAQVFVVDDDSYFIVISRAPQLIGLAKVGAAEQAYISTYLAAVYDKPRRVYMLATLT